MSGSANWCSGLSCVSAAGGSFNSLANMHSSLLENVGMQGNILLTKLLQRLVEVVAECLSCKNRWTFALSHYKCTQESFISPKAACLSREENSPGK